jgi:glycerophosphoryl diester phosphodiesterase
VRTVPATPEAPLTIAHRAGNHLHLMYEATQLGVDLIEADVHFHRGRLEVRHLKTMGPIPLLWDRWALVPAWRPRFFIAGLLEAAEPHAHLMFDLKGSDPELSAQLLAILREEAHGRPYTVCSQAWHLLEPFRHESHVTVVHSVGSERLLRRVPDVLTWHDKHAISIHSKLLDHRRVKALQQVAPTIMTWPINTQERLERVLDYGVNGIISDELDLLRTLVPQS